MNKEINNKLQRGLALTVKESWELYKYIKALEQTELNPSYNSVKTELKPCDTPRNNLAETSQDVLDKIRAEIEAKIVRRPWLDFEDRERDRNDAFLEVLDIIDKYTVESEE